MPMSERAGFYINAIKDAVKEYGREYLDSPLDHTLNLAEGTAYFAADVFVPGGIDNAVDFYNGEISLNEAAVYQAAGAGADIFLGGMVKKAGAKVARALSTASKGLTKKVVEKVTRSVRKEAPTNPWQRVRDVGDAGQYNELTNGAPRGGWRDNLETHHMPSRRYLIANNTMNPNEGFGVVMTREQHALTRTHGRKGAQLATSNPYRSEIAQDLQDCIRILKEDGSWNSEVRRSIMSGLDNFRQEFPHLFERITR